MRLTYRRALTVTLVLALAGCGGFRDSRLNPLNWFGRSQEGPATLTPKDGYSAEDPRPLVAEVTALSIEQTDGGAIVSATGLPPTQGWWDAELIADNDGLPNEDGVLTYRFVVVPPPGQRRVSTAQSREVTAGDFLSNIDLQTISSVVVQGQANSRSVSR
mgnify:FL=1